MWYRAPSLEAALALAEQMKASGKASWFRGQTRPWPLLSSLVRMDAAQRDGAVHRLGMFEQWLHSVPALEDIAGDLGALLAVAQHYGLATNLIDFTTEPRVAAFFAAHEPPAPGDVEDLSCIIFLDYQELRKTFEFVKVTRPRMPEPKAITVNVPELWRLHAQRGVFLEYPYDTGFERQVFGFDRILFPTEREAGRLANLIPLEDIYPTQKSELEMLLDQFFMIERMVAGSKAIKQLADGGLIAIQQWEEAPDGLEAECFSSGHLPVHESWEESRLAPWLRPPREDWAPISTAPIVNIEYPANATDSEKLKAVETQILAKLIDDARLRGGPIRWALDGAGMDAAGIESAMALVWDGLRRWPYTEHEIGQALATTVVFGVLVAEHPTARHHSTQAEALAKRCLGDVEEVEIAMEDRSYTRGYVNRALLQEAVRDDFWGFLTDEWRPQITDVRHVLQVAFNPRRAFVFDQLKSVFCRHIVPTQVILRDVPSGKARLFNPVRATRFGLP